MKTILPTLSLGFCCLLLFSGCTKQEKMTEEQNVVIPKTVDNASNSTKQTSVDSAKNNSDANTPSANMANPASVYCNSSGGKLEIRTGSDGGQVGYCVFAEGKECEEWAMMRGECPVGGK